MKFKKFYGNIDFINPKSYPTLKRFDAIYESFMENSNSFLILQINIRCKLEILTLNYGDNNNLYLHICDTDGRFFELSTCSIKNFENVKNKLQHCKIINFDFIKFKDKIYIAI